MAVAGLQLAHDVMLGREKPLDEAEFGGEVQASMHALRLRSRCDITANYISRLPVAVRALMLNGDDWRH